MAAIRMGMERWGHWGWGTTGMVGVGGPLRKRCHPKRPIKIRGPNRLPIFLKSDFSSQGGSVDCLSSQIQIFRKPAAKQPQTGNFSLCDAYYTEGHDFYRKIWLCTVKNVQVAESATVSAILRDFLYRNHDLRVCLIYWC